MPKEPIARNYFTFVRGLITEASALTFPENASYDEKNFVLNRDGSRRRRQGIDYEDGYELSVNIDKDLFSERAISTHLWPSVGGDGAFSMLLVQLGNLVYFFNYAQNNISADQIPYIIRLDDFALPNTVNAGTEPIIVRSGNGQLFIVSKEIQPIYIKYNTTTTQLETNTIDISIRDFEGVYDGLAIDKRPATLSADHEYNLINQGWTDTHIASYRAATATYPSNADIWNLARDSSNNFSASELDKLDLGNTPAPKGRNIINVFNKIRESGNKYNYLDIASISNIFSTDGLDHLSKYADAVLWGFTITTSIPHNLINSDVVYISTLPEVLYNILTPPPSYKYSEVRDASDLLNRKAMAITVTSPTSFQVYITGTVVDTLPVWPTNVGTVRGEDRTYSVDSEYIGTRPSALGFWAGRAWYGGINDTRYSSMVFFSQLLVTDANIGKCYQAADPTSEHISDLIATDGGVIPIPEMGEVTSFVAVSDSIIIFADNGVWQIKGGESDIFKADDYYIRKVSDVGTTSPETIVQAEGSLLYWADGGIYSLEADKVTNNLTASNLTEETIQTKYNSFSAATKLYAKGTYDNAQKKIYWTYNSDTSYTGSSFKNKYDSILVLDLGLQAFSIYSIEELASNSPYISAPIVSAKTTVATIALNVVVNGDQVQVNSDNVTTDVDYPASGASKIKFLTAVPQTDGENYKITFSDFNDSSFYDWRTNDGTGIDASAYIETGFDLLSDEAIRDKNVENLYTYLRKTETGFVDDGSGNVIYENPSSCLGSAKWNWSNNSISGKETATFQCYKFDRIYIPTGAGDPFTDGTYVVDTKNNITGQGKSIRFRFETETGNDCWLLGWSTVGGVNAAP